MSGSTSGPMRGGGFIIQLGDGTCIKYAAGEVDFWVVGERSKPHFGSTGKDVSVVSVWERFAAEGRDFYKLRSERKEQNTPGLAKAVARKIAETKARKRALAG